MTRRSILEQFLAEECTEYVYDLLKNRLEAGELGAEPGPDRFEFNRFEVTFDFDANNVLIEDVLDGTEAGAHVSVGEFAEALRKHQPR